MSVNGHAWLQVTSHRKTMHTLNFIVFYTNCIISFKINPQDSNPVLWKRQLFRSSWRKTKSKQPEKLTKEVLLCQENAAAHKPGGNGCKISLESVQSHKPLQLPTCMHCLSMKQHPFGGHSRPFWLDFFSTALAKWTLSKSWITVQCECLTDRINSFVELSFQVDLLITKFGLNAS